MRAAVAAFCASRRRLVQIAPTTLAGLAALASFLKDRSEAFSGEWLSDGATLSNFSGVSIGQLRGYIRRRRRLRPLLLSSRRHPSLLSDRRRDLIRYSS